MTQETITAPNGLPIEVTEKDKTRAEAAKAEANALFGKGNYEEAIKHYTTAISFNPSVPAYYSNRALCYIKTEALGYAIRDADLALSLDSSFVKAYYRRAVANMALNKLKDALADFRKVVKVAPNDRDARAKLAECEKEVKRRAFEEAMAYDELHMTAVERLGDIDAVNVEDSYDGPRLEGDGNSITREFVTEMLEYMKKQKRVHKKFVWKIMLAVKSIFESCESLVDVSVADGEKLTVVGDVHGQYYDLLNIWEKNGYPSQTHKYLFNGDFVDRGSFSVEVILALFAFKVLYPNSLFLSRGNHETDDMNAVYGFSGEVKTKYNDITLKLFSEIFNACPLAHVIQKRVLVVHGGLFSRDDVTLDDIRKIDRFRQPGSEGLMCELLWADPIDTPGRSPSKRGVGLQFGPDVTEKFCKLNGLDCIIRSHEVKQEGYVKEHNGRCITVFSAPNYCDNVGNQGAYINFTSSNDEKGYSMDFVQFSAVPHPAIKPMAYSSGFFGNMM